MRAIVRKTPHERERSPPLSYSTLHFRQPFGGLVGRRCFLAHLLPDQLAEMLLLNGPFRPGLDETSANDADEK